MKRCVCIASILTAVVALSACGRESDETDPSTDGDAEAVARIVNQTFDAQRRGDAEGYCNNLTDYAKSALVKVSEEGTEDVTTYDPSDCEAAFDQLKMSRMKVATVKPEQVRFESENRAEVDEPGSTGNILVLSRSGDEWKLESPFFYGR